MAAPGRVWPRQAAALAALGRAWPRLAARLDTPTCDSSTPGPHDELTCVTRERRSILETTLIHDICMYMNLFRPTRRATGQCNGGQCACPLYTWCRARRGRNSMIHVRTESCQQGFRPHTRSASSMYTAWRMHGTDVEISAMRRESTSARSRAPRRLGLGDEGKAARAKGSSSAEFGGGLRVRRLSYTTVNLPACSDHTRAPWGAGAPLFFAPLRSGVRINDNVWRFSLTYGVRYLQGTAAVKQVYMSTWNPEFFW